MPGNLTFKVGDVRKLYEHSKRAALHSPSWAHIYEAEYHKGGVVLNEQGEPCLDNANPLQIPDEKNVDNALIPACLVLVGDQGVYLMSNGIPELTEGKIKDVHVAYANECDPCQAEDWYENKCDIFGGDDGCIPLPVDMFERVMTLPDEATFKVKMTSRNVSVMYPEPRAKPITLRVGMSFTCKNPLKLNSGQLVTNFELVIVGGKKCRASYLGENNRKAFFNVEDSYVKSLLRAGNLTLNDDGVINSIKSTRPKM